MAACRRRILLLNYNTMNIKIPHTPIVIGVAAIILLVVILMGQCSQSLQKHEVIHTIKGMKEITSDSTKYWRDRYDMEHAEKYMLEGDLQEMKTVYEDMITT